MIYHIEDDQNIRDLVLYTLERAGFECRGFASGQEFFRACHDQLPELVLLDVMLPGEDGISILRRIRASKDTKRLPVMLITAKGSEYDKVIGLDSGADDYMAKPFGMMEMLSRVRALLRRSVPVQELESLRAGALEINLKKRIVSVNAEPVALTFKEFELLKFLMENPGIVFGRERLLEVVWGYDYDGGTRTVDVHVRTLRQKLGTEEVRIETVRGVGYRFGEEP